MKNKRLCNFLLPIIFFVLLVYSANSQTKGNSPTWGLIFNTGNLLQGLEEYNGGVGLKYKLESKGKELMDLRGIVNLDLLQIIDNFSIGAGLAVEFHLLTGQQVSPYWGFFADLNVNRMRSEIPPVNLPPVDYSENWDFGIRGGGILGIECFLLDFLSIFAEYQAAAYFSILSSYASNAIDGAENPLITTSFKILTEMGNNAKLGVVIYSRPVVTVKK